MRAANVLNLGIKELRSLRRDPLMMILIIYAFTLSTYTAATAMPETLHQAPIAVVDHDRSQLSTRIIDAFYPPYFRPPVMVDLTAMDAGMDAGRFTFGVVIPPGFQRDILARRSPALQLNVDATRMSQAFSGAGYIQSIVTDEVRTFMQGHGGSTALPAELALRARFNPELNQIWFGSVMQVISNVTMLSMILTGAALIREREHGTIEHLLVMPVTPFEIMAAKVWSMGLVVLVAAGFSLVVVVQWALSVPIAGSVVLFMAGAALHLFATTSLGIMLATVARSMPQFGILLLLVLLPIRILSGAITPRESMPEIIQTIMLAAPETHFVLLGQAILYRGAGLAIVWPQFLLLAIIGAVLFGYSLARFRRTLSTMA